jgi:cytochrome d ubiquinol oxidase subunit I
MDLDVVWLSRVQFALTIMFHYLFPPLTIGMGVVLVYLEAMFLRTRQPIYEIAARFWTQLFAVTFAVGVATGIVMEFQFGTNWAAYSRFVGDVFGSALAAEGIFAFFLESGFLAVLVFGWDKVSPAFHFFATLMVSLGSMFSALWIVVANSWQQTPAGHHIVQMTRDGQPWFVGGAAVMRAEVADFWAVVFNPSTTDRLTHTLMGAVLMGAFFIMSISAYYLLKRRHEEFARRSFTGALALATIFSLAQLVSGHANAMMVAKHQPAKLAAFEGHFSTGPGPSGMTLVGWPNVEAGNWYFTVEAPGLLSYLVHSDFTTPVMGLDRIPRPYWPPVVMSFLSYRTMVLIGVYFVALTLLASLLRLRGTLFQKRWLLWIFVGTVLLAVAGNQLGWIAAEVGRQPWTVHPRFVRDAAGAPVLDAQGLVQYDLAEGLLTSRAASEAVSGEQVLGSMIMFGLIYLLLGAVWAFVLNHKIAHGPEPIGPTATTTARAVLDTAALRAGHGQSMSESKSDSGPSAAGGQ